MAPRRTPARRCCSSTVGWTATGDPAGVVVPSVGCAVGGVDSVTTGVGAWGSEGTGVGGAAWTGEGGTGAEPHATSEGPMRIARTRPTAFIWAPAGREEQGRLP